MGGRITRRGLLRTAATGSAMVGLCDLSFLSKLPPVAASEAKQAPSVVGLDADIEPVVRLLEETPRERLLEEVAARIRRGLSYREIVAALLLAGVRDVQPRPAVGFKFHAVLVINSVHMASISAAATERWLPVFWALDYFKHARAQDQQEGGWRMRPVDEAAVPPGRKAHQAFAQAMDNWDEAAADAAVAGLARTAADKEVFELLYRYAARDFRSIGHKAIFVANGQRALAVIGWRHAEPILRSMAYALLMHEGESPAGRDAPADRPWRRNQALAGKIGPKWENRKPSGEATVDLLAVLRRGSSEAACDKVVELLRRGIAPQSVWDALFCGAAELLLRQPGIVALHAVTMTNAMHAMYRATGDDLTRRLLVLQNAAFLPMFREAIAARGSLADLHIDGLKPLPLDNSGAKPVEEIFAEVSRGPMASVGKTLGYLQDKGPAKELTDAARHLVLLKGDDPHDYKFSVAITEDYLHVSPRWRDLYLAASLLRLRGSGEPDNNLIRRIRSALQA